MTAAEQARFLLSLGARLDRWTTPGDDEDHLVNGLPLWNDYARRFVPAPARVIDVLLARWVKIKDFSSQHPVPFVLNPAQRDMSRNATRRDIILKAGRAGFTTDKLCRGLMKVCTQQGFTAVLVTHNLKAAEDYFLQARYAFEHLAGNLGIELRKGILRPGKANVREIYLPELNSHFLIDTAGQHAPAEGTSIQFLIADEMARWKSGDPAQIITTLLSHLTGETAEATLMSRPFGQSGEFYERYWSAKREESNFRPHFFSWLWNLSQVSEVPPGFTPTAEEIDLSEKYERWRAQELPPDCGLPEKLSFGKLQWRRKQRLEDRDLFVQEFAEDEHACFLGSGNCPFDAIATDRVMHDPTPVLERRMGKGESENGLMRWRDPDPAKHYVLFIDPAGTLFTSRIAMQLFEVQSGEQVAEWVGRCDAATAGDIAMSIVHKFQNVVVALELNMGEVSATIMATLCGEPHKLTGDPAVWPRLYKERDSGGQFRLGWKTDAKTRPEMLSKLAEAWEKSPELFHSARLAQEIRTSERVGDRIQHGKGMTDDLILSAAGALKVREKVQIIPPEPHVESLSFKRTPLHSEERENWQRIDVGAF